MHLTSFDRAIVVVALLVSALFGTGSLLYGMTTQAAVWLLCFVGSGIGLVRLLHAFWLERAK